MPVRRSSCLALLSVAATAASFAGAVLFAPSAQAGTVAVAFDEAGGPYVWTVPLGVSAIHIDALGGSGFSYDVNAGAGARVQADLSVVPGSTFGIHVAGNGAGTTAGVNGGGAGIGVDGGAGGGASDVRVGGDALTDRILVAGGGAGGGSFGSGGAAGQPGTNGGGCDDPVAQPGTASAGGTGAGGCDGSGGGNGVLGIGGAAGSRPSGRDYGGGGGGGYFGGGGGGAYGGGGGGSSYVVAGAGNVTTALGSVGAAPYVHITYATPPAHGVAVTPDASSLPADGTSTSTVTAAIDDIYGNAVPGDAVTFSSTDPAVQFGSVTDHGNGFYTATITASTTAHMVTITATDSSGPSPVSGTADITITPLSQAVTITSTPPAAPAVGQSYPLTATAGGSGQPVTFSVDATTTGFGTSAAACSLTGSTVFFDHPGSCVIDGDQAGNAQYLAAPTANQTVAIGRAAQLVSFTSVAPAAPVIGQTYPVAAAGGASGNDVTFAIDAGTTGFGTSATACSLTGSTVSFDHPGSCVVDADQAGSDDYTDAPTARQTVPVGQALTGTSIAVTAASVSATVSVLAPGSGSPTGAVTFAVDGTPVGTATVSGGVATLAYHVPPGKTRNVAAVYSGDAEFVGSSASTARNDPTITAHVHSSSAKTTYGWYRSTVTVSFTCVADGAALTAACPAAVTLSRNAAGQSVTRTINALDGGAATVTVNRINIDSVAPRAAVTGARSGATYFGAPPAARCSGGDTLSGVAACRLTTSRHGATISYTATTADRAGNRASTHGRYQVLDFYVRGAGYSKGAFVLKMGRTYTVVAQTSSRTAPRYYDAVPAGQTPRHGGPRMHAAGTGDGLHRWTLDVGIDHGLGRYKYWVLGVRVGTTMHLIRFHPTA